MSDTPGREDFTTALPSTAVEPVPLDGAQEVPADQPYEGEKAADQPEPEPEPMATATTEATPAIPDDTWKAATEAWINNHIRSSPLARSSEAWNHLMRSLPLLKGFVETELKK